MRIVVVCLLSALWTASPVLAHGGGHRPPPPPPFYPPGSGIPPGHRPTTPPPDPAPPDAPDGPTTPPPGAPPEDHPRTPGETPTPPPPDTPERTPSGRSPDARTRPRGRTDATTWRVWWEYNREYLLGLRRLMRESAAVTGTKERSRDPLVTRRDEVREALRAVVSDPRADPKLRGAASIALGRVGTAEDADRLRAVVAGRKVSDDAATAAALGLGILPRLDDPKARARVRETLASVANDRRRHRQVRGFALVATGLRAGHDPMLSMQLAQHAAKTSPDAYEAAAVVYACGVARDPTLLAELMLAARRGALGRRDLDDVARSHAVFGLGLQKSPIVLDLLFKLLKSRKSGLHTRRAAALALGRLLREAELEKNQVQKARKALTRALEKDRDEILRSYCMIALGGARAPLSTDLLMRVADRTGGPTLQTYAALALGLAARTLHPEGKRIRTFLRDEMDGAKNPEYASALAIALGLARATEAMPELIKRVGSRKLPAAARGAAAEALGLLRQPTPKAVTVLLEGLRDRAIEVVEGSALALGMLGRHGIADDLAKRLAESSSGILQGRITLALGHLGQAEAVDPLLKLLGDRKAKRVVRELAAVALGILADPRDDDVLFDLDAYYNYFATTPLTHELLTIF